MDGCKKMDLETSHHRAEGDTSYGLEDYYEEQAKKDESTTAPAN